MELAGYSAVSVSTRVLPPGYYWATVTLERRHLHGGSLQSLDWNGGMEWWNGIVECVLQGERSLLMQFSMKVTVGVLFLIEFVR